MPTLRFVVHALASVFETIGRAMVGRRRRRAWPIGFEIVVGALRRNFLYAARLPVPEARAFNEAVAAAQPRKHGVATSEEHVGGVAVVRFVPEGSARRALVYLHGGSYLMGSPRTHEDLIARIAREGFITLAVRYRRAPEHTIADACADVCAVIDALAAEGWPASSIAIAGDSAGGGLAFLSCLAQRDARRTMPAAIATIAPWVDLACPGASFETNERFDWGTAEVLRAQGKLAAGTRALDDPSISPTFADLGGLPPTLVHVGEIEMVRDPVEAFAAKLERAGVETELVRWPDMIHDFHLLADQHPTAAKATTDLAAWLLARTNERPM